jgi:hypothetical protein
MDVLLVIATVVGLLVFAGLAARFGVDSRDSLGDDWARQIRA